MLRGNIDVISSNRIAGWVYSEADTVTGKRLLAFADERCIGATEIGQLRPDLRDAGLGDGRLGFEIMVDPSAIRDPNSVHVRLDCSDFALFGKVFYQGLSLRRLRNQQLYTAEELERVSWMNAQGWLSHEQFLGLKALNGLGLYQRTFSRAELQHSPLSQRARDVVVDVLSALFRRPVLASGLEVEQIDEYLPAALNRERHLEVIGLFGDAFAFEALEGAHSEAGPQGATPIRHDNAEHQLLLIHADCLKQLTLPAGRTLSLIRAAR